MQQVAQHEPKRQTFVEEKGRDGRDLCLEADVGLCLRLHVAEEDLGHGRQLGEDLDGLVHGTALLCPVRPEVDDDEALRVRDHLAEVVGPQDVDDGALLRGHGDGGCALAGVRDDEVGRTEGTCFILRGAADENSSSITAEREN